MPTISLRLSEEQHRELAEWAHANHRSIQREVIWRLFRTTAPEAGLDRDDPHFKPDFGKKLK